MSLSGKSVSLGLGLMVLLLLSACNTSQFLTADQVLLTKNTIKLPKDIPLKERRALKTELTPVIKQKPNTSLLGFGRVGLWLYFKHSGPEDSSSWDRWVLNKLAQEPVFFDPSQNEASSKALQVYLQKKGYFLADVDYQEKIKDGLGQVTYNVNPDILYRVQSIRFTSEDPAVDSLLQATRGATLLKPDAPVSQALYDQEKVRIVTLLQQRGYAKFGQSYIPPLRGDTVRGRVNVILEVLPQNNGLPHQRYTLGKIALYPDYQPSLLALPEIDTVIYRYRFVNYGPRFRIRPRVLARNVLLKPEAEFNVDHYNQTLRRLSRLGYYKFQYIKEVPSTDSTRLNYNIYLTPEKRQAFDFSFNINNSNISASRQNYLGFTVPLKYQNRNLFGGAEALTSSIIGGMEFSTRRPYQVRSTQLKVINELTIPAFVNVLGIYRGLGRINVLSPSLYRYLRNNALTKINLGYEYFEITRYYRYHAINASLGYDVFADNNRSHIRYNSIGFNYLIPTIQDTFNTILRNNPVLQRSFGRQLFSGLILRDFLYEHASPVNLSGETYHNSIAFDLSGLEWMTVNYLANQFRDTFRIGETEASQYVKAEFTGSYNKQYGNFSSLFLRANVGVALPFGTSTAVPYVKQFYLGGPNSMRAWRIRELGPGAFRDSLSSDPDFNLPYYQTGDFKLELNAEYRFDIFWRFKGAFFVDMGNVWALNTRVEDTRPNAVLGKDFYKQIAIGTGFGVRMDFTYFIIRFDVGTKLRTPYQTEGKSRNPYYPYRSFSEAWKDVNLNLAIGMPFIGR